MFAIVSLTSPTINRLSGKVEDEKSNRITGAPNVTRDEESTSPKPDETSEEEEDIYICGACRQQFTDLSKFTSHKHICTLRKSKKRQAKRANKEPSSRSEEGSIYLNSNLSLDQASSDSFPVDRLSVASTPHQHKEVESDPLNVRASSSLLASGEKVSNESSKTEQLKPPSNESQQRDENIIQPQRDVKLDAYDEHVNFTTSVCSDNNRIPILSRNSSPPYDQDQEVGSPHREYAISSCPAESLPGLTKPNVVGRNTLEAKKIRTCSFQGCTYKARYNKDIVRHYRTHSGVKPWKCEICDKSFARQDKLSRHMKIHTGEKKFSCEYCLYKTYEKSHYTKHLRVHTDERPYACQVCNYRAKSSSTMTVHLRTHTGICPYPCSYPGCGAVFKTNSDLTRHTKSHARNLT